MAIPKHISSYADLVRLSSNISCRLSDIPDNMTIAISLKITEYELLLEKLNNIGLVVDTGLSDLSIVIGRVRFRFIVI